MSPLTRSKELFESVVRLSFDAAEGASEGFVQLVDLLLDH